MRKLSISVLAVVATAVIAQPVPADFATRIRLQSQVLGEERSFLVRTPLGYEKNQLRYPVLYLTDAETQLGHTAATVDYLATRGRMPQLIIVGINNTDRTRDLTPTRSSMVGVLGDPAELPTAGGADRFLEFLETELIPWVEVNYRTQPYRIFAGHSFGGLFALHALFSRPGLFGGIIAASPTLNWDQQWPAKRGAEFFKNRRDLKTTLYLSIGNEGVELDSAFKRFKSLLASSKARGFSWDAERYDDEDHGTIVLPTHYAGLRKVFEGWQVPVDPATNIFVGGWDGVRAHFKKLSVRFGYTIEVPERTANLLGYQLMGAGKIDDAIAVFRWNVEKHPESANVYDSLGEAYEKSGSLELARTNYARAADLGKKTEDPNTGVYEANLKRVSEKVASAAVRR